MNTKGENLNFNIKIVVMLRFIIKLPVSLGISVFSGFKYARMEFLKFKESCNIEPIISMFSILKFNFVSS